MRIKKILALPTHLSNLTKSDKKISTNWSYWDVFLMGCRNLFFNILNDIFILTIFWASFFTLLYFMGIITLPNPFVFTKFAEAIGVIGILSGFYQIYTEKYRDQSKDLMSSFTKGQLKIIQEVSMDDFLDYLKRTNEQSIITQIKDILFSGEKLVNEHLLRPGAGGSRSTSQINFYGLPSLGLTDTMSSFQYLDAYSALFPDKLKKEHLNHIYSGYFKEKISRFEKSKDADNIIQEMRKSLVSTIIYSDEVLASISKFDVDFPEVPQKPNKFTDFYNQFLLACVDVLLSKLLFGEASQ